MQLTNEQIAEIQEVFSMFDKDQDGKITAEELRGVLQALGKSTTDADLHDMMNEADTNGNGSLDFYEFSAMMVNDMNVPLTEEEFLEAFRVYDKDGNGFITPAEVQQVMADLGKIVTDEEANEMIREVDTDGDGQLNFEEFRTMIRTSDVYCFRG